MKKIAVAGFAALVMVLGTIPLAAPGNAATASSHVKGRIIVKFRDDGAAAGVLRQHGLSQGTGIGSTGAYLIKVSAGKELQLVEVLSRHPAVEYAEPDVAAAAAISDPYFERQYALENTGKAFTNTDGTLSVAAGKPDADVDAPDAWNITRGNGTRVAIIDSGVAIDHEDISSKVVERTNFSDTVITSSEDYDRYGHGTHVAGIVAAIHNSAGVAGVCPECTILDAKVLNNDGSGSASAIARGIDWAVSKEAKVINMSLALRISSRTLETAVNNAWRAGAVLVAAAGNVGTQAKIYPGAYPNVIAVAATDNSDLKASFSTYSRWVDLAAPGVSVYSTFPNHAFVLGDQYKRHTGYDVSSGTSMASPVVAGVAALAWSSHAEATNSSVRSNVETTAEVIDGTGTYWAYGRVNAWEAVKSIAR